MARIYYNKLVRDKIQDKIEGQGEACAVRVITDPDEFTQELCKKIREEADGLAHARSRAEFLGEYADLMVVLDALSATLDISEAELKVAMEENIEKKGLYKLQHFLHWSNDSGYKSNETPQGVK